MGKYSVYLHKLYWNINEQGISGSFRKLLYGFWRELFHGSEHLFYLDLSHIPDKELHIPQNVQIDTFIKKEDIPEQIMDSLKDFVRKKGMKEEFEEYYLGKILNLYKHGAALYVAKVDNKPAAYLWSITDKGNYTPYFSFFTLVPEDALLFGGVTLPPYRGKGLVPMLIRHGAYCSKKNGKKRVYATCKTWNISSFRCIVKAGLKEITIARGVRVFGKRIAIWPKIGKRNQWTDTTI